MALKVLGGVAAAALAIAIVPAAASAQIIEVNYTGDVSIYTANYGSLTENFSLDATTTDTDILDGNNSVLLQNVELTAQYLGTTSLPDIGAVYENNMLDLYSGGLLLAGFTLDLNSLKTDGTSYASIDASIAQLGTYTLPGFGCIQLRSGDGTFTVSLPQTPGVPEPATWAMMIAGFGLVGGTLRQRQHRTAFAAA